MNIKEPVYPVHHAHNIMKTFTILVLCLYALAGYSQQRVKPQRDTLIRTVTDISSIVLNNYQPSADSLSNNCIKAIVFIKFNISRTGKFVNLDYTIGTPVFIMDALTKAFKIIQSKVAISNLDAVSKETYVIPFLYDHNQGCNFPYGSVNNKRDTPTDAEKRMYELAESKHDRLEDFVFDINRFTDSYHSQLHCVILPPIGIGATMW